MSAIFENTFVRLVQDQQVLGGLVKELTETIKQKDATHDHRCC